MNAAQRAALAVIAVTYGAALVYAFVLHPRFALGVLVVLGVAMLVLVVADGQSIGRGRDEWDGRR